MGRSLRSLTWRALAGALLALAALTSPTFAASASSVVKSGGAPLIGGFSARALDENGRVTPQTYFDLKLKPGESYDGEILVTNAAKTFVRLRVDSVDGLTGTTSGTVYANRTDPRKETSLWIEPKKEALRLDAKSARTLPFHLEVPDDATPGDHVGAIAFQRILNPKKEGEFAVRQVLRVAVAIQIRVEGPAQAQLEIGGMSLKALGGTQIPSVNVDLKNTGQLLCRPSLTVTLSQNGQGLGTVSRQLDTVLAGDTIPYPLPWPKPLESGKYEAAASTTGCGQPAQAKATVELASSLKGNTSAPGPDSAALADDPKGLPWWAMVLIALAALGVGFFIARRSNRRKDEPAAPAAPAAAAAVPVAEEPAAAAATTPAEPVKAVAVEPEPAKAVEPEPAKAVEPEPAKAPAVEPEPAKATPVEPEPDTTMAVEPTPTPTTKLPTPVPKPPAKLPTPVPKPPPPPSDPS